MDDHRLFVLDLSAPNGAYPNKRTANHTNEFIISLDDPTQDNTDIELSDRYAIKLDLQWLWYEAEDIKKEESVSEITTSPLAPWFICKYRF